MATNTNSGGVRDLQSKVTEVEVGLQHLEQEHKLLRNELRESFAGLTGKLDGVVRELNNRSRTPWAILISLAGLIIVIGGLAFRPFGKDLERHERSIDALPIISAEYHRLDERVRQHEAELDPAKRFNLADYDRLVETPLERHDVAIHELERIVGILQERLSVGDRFTMDDYDRWVAPRLREIDDLEERLDALSAAIAVLSERLNP